MLTNNFIFAGQLFEIAKQLYGIDLEIYILEEHPPTDKLKHVLIVYRLNFDNRDYVLNFLINILKNLYTNIGLVDFFY